MGLEWSQLFQQLFGGSHNPLKRFHITRLRSTPLNVGC
jgi:hypothetical protein